ncbi:protein encore-like isoform X2 [Aricia agestis]|uniref:protein encore-like isoform X2 n=1 Tax=Aricia agestis TaxID=91739 RepID=UPI001C20420A|nr:protein encore-like isoform X2 [Aricia agestis]
MMEQPEVEKSCPSSDDAGLARTRSFKSKQLVRSSAIREAASPPRVASPAPPAAAPGPAPAPASNGDRTDDESSHSDKCSVISSDRKCDDRKKQVEIQITCGAWEEGASGQRLRARRWLGHRHHSDSSRDLLSHAPRRTCVCGACACPHCRGRRSKQQCPTKQDSGIVCSEDCPDCTDNCNDHNGHNGDVAKRSGSFDNEEQGFYCRCPERKEKPKSFSLTRTDSEDKMEPTGPELVNFIKETLNKNPRDRMTLLRIEKDLHALINDTSRCIVRFPVMTSYGRMLVHRCAALFGLAHHLDHAHKNAVLVSKSGTSGGRIPCTSFRQWCTTVFPKSPPRRHDDTLAKSILKREGGGALGGAAGAAPRSKSLEQRERDYERVRRRIFSSDNCTQDENQWPWLNSGPVKLLTPETGRNKLLKVQSLEASGGGAAGGAGSGSRGPVAKSHSFGGYSEPPQRLLSRQGDLASSSWRLSPSSSGYKTLSLRSTDSVTPSPTGGASPEPTSEASAGGGAGIAGAGGGALVWAVTDLSAVPVGAVVIHPQTGRALTNPDGTLYHFHPDNPPPLYDANAALDEKDPNGDKKRGKLEKQHSFIDHECDCSGEYRGKCCCECRRREPCREHAEKTTSKESQTGSIPSSPAKDRYIEPSTPDANTDKSYENQSAPTQLYDSPTRTFDNTYESPKRLERYDAQNSPKTFEPANQRMPYEATNQRSFEAANQRPPFENQRSYDSTRQYSKECEQQCYVQPMRSEESPMGVQNYVQEEAKTTPVPLVDHTIRPMSLTNVSYPLMQQPYHYVNRCRIEPHMQAPMYQLQPEEPKVAHDNTFRIDPSYPYAADFSACGACEPQPRQYTMPYGVELGAQYLPNVILPPAPPAPPAQPHHYPQYQEMQWGGLQPPLPISPAAPKLMLHDVYPLVYPPLYPNPQYGVVYPAAPLQQMIPQPYPMCQAVYGVEKAGERRASYPKRGSLPPSQRATPHADDRADPDIAVKIQQIKEQMAAVSTRDRQWERPRRRNSGSGLLGSYPAPAPHPAPAPGPAHNARPLGRSPSEEAQLSSAARAIVNSIRTMQAKNNTYPDRRGPEAREQYRRARGPAPAVPAPPPDRPRRPYNPIVTYRPPYLLRQMSPGTWCRRSPGAATPVMNNNQPRRPHPDTRNGRR